MQTIDGIEGNNENRNFAFAIGDFDAKENSVRKTALRVVITRIVSASGSTRVLDLAKSFLRE